MPWVFGMPLQCLNHVIHPRVFRNVVMTMERLHISREKQSCHAASRSSGTSNRFGVGRAAVDSSQLCVLQSTAAESFTGRPTWSRGLRLGLDKVWNL